MFCVTSPIAGSLSTYMIQTRAFNLNRLQTRKLFEGIGNVSIGENFSVDASVILIELIILSFEIFILLQLVFYFIFAIVTALYSQSLCFILLPLIGCSRVYVLVLLFVQIALYSLINGGEVQLPSELTLGKITVLE